MQEGMGTAVQETQTAATLVRTRGCMVEKIPWARVYHWGLFYRCGLLYTAHAYSNVPIHLSEPDNVHMSTASLGAQRRSDQKSKRRGVKRGQHVFTQ